MRRHSLGIGIGFLAFTLAAGTPALAQDGMSWHYTSYGNPDRPGDGRRLVLSYGIPESDAVQFRAECDAAPGAAVVASVIAAETGRRREGAAADIRFAGAGFDTVIQGSIVGTRREEGITGVAFRAVAEHPLWEAVRGQRELSYSITGQRASRLPLRGSSEPVARFLADCTAAAVALAGGSPATAPVAANDRPVPRPVPAAAPPAMPASAAACAMRQSLRSVNGGEKVVLTFINRSNGHRGVLWIDYEGVPKDFASLAQGETFRVETFVGHPWMITDGPGNCLEVHMPQAGQGTFAITAPNRRFGPE